MYHQLQHVSHETIEIDTNQLFAMMHSAETSVTIDGIRFIVDSGKEKEMKKGPHQPPSPLFSRKGQRIKP